MRGELTQAEVEEKAEAEKPKARQRKEVRPGGDQGRCAVVCWTALVCFLETCTLATSCAGRAGRGAQDSAGV